MNLNPLVSIVTPSFNQVNFIEQTILSVLNQTYKNIEYIIIDGGSTDGSLEIIKHYSPSLKYWASEKDSGQTEALLKGLKQSKGQLFAYINSDDLLEPNAVQLMVDAFISTPQIALIYGQCQVIDENNNIISPFIGESISFKKLLTQSMMPSIHQPACFFNLNQIDRTLFDVKYSFCFDYELILWIFKNKEAKFIKEHIAQYRIHKETKTNVFTKKMYEEKLKIQWQYGKKYWPLWILRRFKHFFNSLITNI